MMENLPNLDYNSIYGGLKEPNIVKAKFMLPTGRSYTLEFDQNITIFELKLMIQKAAHLPSKNFRIFSNGVEYTKYNQETFESLFHEQILVEFTLEFKLGEVIDESILLLQMNSPCNFHIDKFLLYYCFTCGESICSDCFTQGVHKGHKIQDKCFYLLPSKYLVDKLFANWSQNPYEDYQFSEDKTIADLRININKIIFDKILESIKAIQTKVTNLLEQYHYINYQSFEKTRNSIRDIKLFCIKILDDLKERMDIKNIIDNDQIFLDFHKAYIKLGELQNNKYNYNYILYQEFKQQIPGLITNLVNDINDKILLSLNKIVIDQRFETILNQMQIKSVKSFDQEEIKKQINAFIKPKYSGFTKKRLTINYKYADDLDNNYKKNNIIDKEKGRKTLEPNNIPSLNLHKNNNIDNNLQIKNPNVFSFKISNINNAEDLNQKYPNLFNNNINNTNNLTITNNNVNNIGKNYAKINITKPILNQNEMKQNIIKTTTTTTVEKIIQNPTTNILSGNIQSNITIKPNIKNKNIIINDNNAKDCSYSSSHITRQYTEGLFNSENHPILNSEKINYNQKSKINNNTLNDSFSSNHTIQNINKMVEESINKNNYINNLNNQNGIQTISNNNEITNKTISTYINNGDNKNLINNQQNIRNNAVYSFGINYNTIPEEILESESEAFTYGFIKNLINKEYILAPIHQTNYIKLITSDEDAKIIPLKFPNNLEINEFLRDSSYCNHNKNLYITGGISNNKKKTDISLLVNLNLKENQIIKLSSMNYIRSGHSMISYDNYLFAVGGENQSSVERYNISDNIWEKLNPMNYKRMYPILAIYNGYLYALFGKSNENEFCNTIERLRLSNNIEKEKWEMVQFNNPQNIDTRIYGSAVYIINNSIYLFGGKYNEKASNNIIYFVIKDNDLLKEENYLNINEYFRENKLHKMKNGDLMQISDGKYDIFCIHLN